MVEVEKKGVKEFIHRHKVILAVTTGVVVGGLGYFGFKYLPRNNSVKVRTAIETGKQLVEPIIKELPYKEIWNNLSGDFLTPTGLGNEVLISAQKINKRLVECGLQNRTPCGEYMLTELGRKFGKSVLKVTYSGHTFSNIEWDKRVLEILFSPEELMKASEFRKLVVEVMSA